MTPGLLGLLLLDHIAQHVERGVEPPLTATVPFVVGFGRDVADQLVEIIEIPVQHDATV